MDYAILFTYMTIYSLNMVVTVPFKMFSNFTNHFSGFHGSITPGFPRENVAVKLRYSAG